MKPVSDIDLEEANTEQPVAIVFIHGNSMSKKIWQRQLQSPLLQQFHMIAPDLPGHGESRRQSEYSLTGIADNVTDLVISANKPCILVGNSLGGDIVLQAAERLSSCFGIVLVNVIPAGKPLQQNLLLPVAAANYLFSPALEDDQAEQLAECLMKKEIRPNFIKTDLQDTDGNFRTGLLQSIMQGAYEDEPLLLEKIKIPVSLFWGDQEQIYNYEAKKGIKLESVTIKNGSHCPQWDRAEAFNTQLYQFINKALSR